MLSKKKSNMQSFKTLTLVVLFLATGFSYSQNEDQKEERVPGHYNNNPFKQLYEEFSTPNQYRSASGAPGPAYYQQQADYKMDIVLNDDTAVLYGTETITYTNN